MSSSPKILSETFFFKKKIKDNLEKGLIKKFKMGIYSNKKHTHVVVRCLFTS